jgi:hypothetical protein
MTLYRVFSAALVLGVVCACGGPTPQEASLAREIAAMQPMRGAFDGTVVGFDAKDTRLDVGIDLNQWETIDDDADQAIKTEALDRWKKAWSKENPGKHATLTVRLIDYHGREFFRESAKV